MITSKTCMAVFAVIGLSACASSFSGITGSSSALSCKAPAGVLCNSVSGIYANSINNALPAQQLKSSEVEDKKPSKMNDSIKRTDEYPARFPVNANTLRALSSGTPIRTEPLVLRVWVAPWEDAEGDLHDQHYLYAVVNQSKWSIEVNQERIRAQFRPVFPLKGKETNSEEKSETVLPLTEPLSATPQQETVVK